MVRTIETQKTTQKAHELTMSIEKPSKIDVASYIEIITINSQETRKAVRDDGNVNNSVNALAYRNNKISQNQEEVDQNAPRTVDYTTIGTSKYSPNAGTNTQQPTTILFSNINNPYTDNILPQAYGEQEILQNCPTGTNIYYDGEDNTEITIHGWIQYNTSRIGINNNIPNILYEDGKIKVKSYLDQVKNDPVIEQYYTSTPYAGENEELIERIRKHLQDLDTTITELDNIFFYFTAKNNTNSIAWLSITCGKSNSIVEIRPLSTSEINVSGIADNITKISINAITNITSSEYVELSNFKICLEKQGAELSKQCNGIDIAFNGSFNSGIIGWDTEGYVVAANQQISMSSECGGYTQDPSISQTHYAGSGITPIGTELYEEDRIKVIVNAFNDSASQSDITIGINGKSQTYILQPQESKILAYQSVIQANTVQSTITAKTYPKPEAVSDIMVMMPISGGYTYRYELLYKNISKIFTGNADAVLWCKNNDYLYMCTYVEALPVGMVAAINRVKIDGLIGTQESFCQINLLPNSSIVSIGRLTDQYLYILRKVYAGGQNGVDYKIFIDWYNVSTKALFKTQELSTYNNIRNGLHNAASVCCCLDERNQRLILGARSIYNYESNIFFDYIYEYNIIDSSVRTINSALSDFIMNVAIDDENGNILASYRGRKPASSKYMDDINGYESQYYKSSQIMKSFTSYGEYLYGTEIYRNDRPLDTIDGNIVAQNPPYNTSPVLAMTYHKVGDKKFILWAKNEPVVKNSIGKVNGNDTEYVDQYGYNKNHHIYCVEYHGQLPTVIGKSTPSLSIHKPYPVTNSNQPLVIW